MYPSCPSEWSASHMRHSPYDMPRVSSTFVSPPSERSICTISGLISYPRWLLPATGFYLSHGFLYAATDLSHGFLYAAIDGIVDHERRQRIDKTSTASRP